MIYDVAVAIGLGWAIALFGGAVVVLVRARGVLQRAIAADLLVIVLVAVLALLAYLRDQPFYLDAALIVASLAFVGTVAIGRFHARGKVF